MDDRRLTTLLERAYPDAPVPSLERLAQRAAVIRRRRRTRRVAGAVVVTAAIVAVVVVVSLPALDRRSIQTPLRPVPTRVPTRIPDVSKTHAIVVTPSTGLRDGQIVSVSSGRIVANEMTVWICRAGATQQTAGNDCDPTTAQRSTVDYGARHRVIRRLNCPYMVRRTITLGGQLLDCAAAPGCVLYAGSTGPQQHQGPEWQYEYGVAPLAFDPEARPAPGPTVTVTPPDGLRDGDVVTVRGHHFRPFDWATVAVCVDGTDVCDGVGVSEFQVVGSNGSFSGTHGVWSVFSSADGTLRDCRSVACVVRLEDDADAHEQVDVPVSFAPSSPASYPRLTLDPAGPYTDGQQVTVTLQGWPGSIGHYLSIESLTVGQCARSGGAVFHQCAGETVLRGPEADGRYTATLALHRTVSGRAGEPIDCTQPGSCQVALALDKSPPRHYFILILAVDVVVT